MCIYTRVHIVKIVSCYDLGVPSMSVTGLKKKCGYRWWVGRESELYTVLFWFFEFFQLCEPHNGCMSCRSPYRHSRMLTVPSSPSLTTCLYTTTRSTVDGRGDLTQPTAVSDTLIPSCYFSVSMLYWQASQSTNKKHLTPKQKKIHSDTSDHAIRHTKILLHSDLRKEVISMQDGVQYGEAGHVSHHCMTSVVIVFHHSILSIIPLFRQSTHIAYVLPRFLQHSCLSVFRRSFWPCALRFASVSTILPTIIYACLSSNVFS